MAYKITIEKIEQVTRVEKGEYTVVDRRPWTDEDLKSASSPFYREVPLVEKEPLKEVRDYAPSRNVTRIETTKVFEQTVDGLHLADVIKAVNGLT